MFWGKLDANEYVTVEEYVEGSFVKHTNNNGNICGDTSSPVCRKAECLAHYSFERSNKGIMVVDIQGCDYFLLDPEIASRELKSNEEFLFVLAINNKKRCDKQFHSKAQMQLVL